MLSSCLLFLCLTANGQLQGQPTQQISDVAKQQLTGAEILPGAISKPPTAAPYTPARNGTVERPAENCFAKCGEFKSEKDWWHDFKTDPVATFTGLLFFATAALWWATRNLVRSANQNARVQLRAYLGIGGGEVFILPNSILRGVVEIKNFGETPAYKVRPAITGELREPGDTRPFTEPEFMRHNQPIAPTMHWTFGHEFINMTSEDLQEVATDRKLVYIWGRVQYEDIYGEQRTLKFRFRNVVKVLIPTETGTAIQKWKFYPEDEGNEST